MTQSAPENPPPARHPDEPSEPAPGKQRSSLLRGVMRHVSRVGQQMVSVTVGKWLEEADGTAEPQPPDDPESQARAGLDKRVNVLHHVTEKLRGAADGYIAAKLDEMEARVDAKLDHIEHRIDHKIVQLHKQLAEMRDRELRHRLRLLKITLIFTVLVALLSLGYKWISSHWS